MNDSKFKIAVYYIATGNYKNLFPEFLESVQNLFPEHKKIVKLILSYLVVLLSTIIYFNYF